MGQLKKRVVTVGISIGKLLECKCEVNVIKVFQPLCSVCDLVRVDLAFTLDINEKKYPSALVKKTREVVLYTEYSAITGIQSDEDVKLLVISPTHGDSYEIL